MLLFHQFLKVLFEKYCTIVTTTIQMEITRLFRWIFVAVFFNYRWYQRHSGWLQHCIIMVLEHSWPNKKYYSCKRNDWHLPFLRVIQISSSISNLAEPKTGCRSDKNFGGRLPISNTCRWRMFVCLTIFWST